MGVAVIGMACRIPKAPDLEAFWNLLAEGRQSLSVLDGAALEAAGVPADVHARPDYVKAAHVLEDVDRFAADFFGYTPTEAELLDPQHRVFLELAHAALEDAGYGAGRSHLKVGVFAGCSTSTYFLDALRADAGVDPLQVRIANEKDYLSLRVGYKLDLRGPCVSIQAACSTSLVAVAAACESLRSRGTDMALAGGVSVAVPQGMGYRYRRGGLLSPDGCCRAFSDGAAGTAPGSGAGVVLLRRLDDALRDGDHVYAVIRGASVNNDGAARVGFTAPGVEGQIAVIREAQAQAGIPPESVSYVECHGSGTALGDPVEISAMTQAFATPRTGYCAIGSVKSNIGHLDCAAGIAGFIKTVLALHRRMIPPSLHYERPNRAIDFERTPFFVNPVLRPWDAVPLPRRAGVSSFGLGGTNAHVVLEEAPPPGPGAPGHGLQILPLSARTPASLRAVCARLESHLRSHPDVCLADVAFTLACGRTAYPYRRALVCRNVGEAVRLLAAGPGDAGAAVKSTPLLLVFPGEAVSPDAAQRLWERERVFREAFALAAAALGGAGRERARRAAETGCWTLLAGAPEAPFAAEYAMASLWKAWGLGAGGVAGRGAGLFAAAALAGVFTLDEAARRACGLPGLGPPRAPAGVRVLSTSGAAWMQGGEACREESWRPERAAGEDLDAAIARLGAAGWVAERCGLPAGGDPESAFRALAARWECGCAVDWRATYAGERRRRVPLPTYPFERARYWREAGRTRAGEPVAPGAAAALETWFYSPSWKRVPLPRAQDPVPRRRWLVMGDHGRAAPDIVRQLREAGQDAVLAGWGEAFEALDDGSFRLDPTSADDQRRLLDALRGGPGLPDDCVHLGGLDDPSARALRAVQAFLQAWWIAAGDRRVRIHAVGAGMVDATGDEPLRPERAMWMALWHAAAAERREADCRVIDAGVAPETGEQARALAARLLPALVDADGPALAAIRGRHRWTRAWEPLVPSAPGRPVLRSGGAYLITGGFGGVGAAIARELVSAAGARVALVGRTPLPPACEWDLYLASAAASDVVAERVRRVREIEALGGVVVPIQADVSDERDAERAVLTAAERLGGLDGIVHAAGLPGGSLLLRDPIDLGAGAFPAKVAGTRAIWRAARLVRPDFVALMSSVLALTGFPGMADYCAANAFMDAFAAEHDGDDGIRVIAIAWGMWRWNTWQESYARLDAFLRDRLDALRREWGFAPDEGARAFVRALECGLPHLVVSRHGGPLPAAAAASSAEAPAADAPRHGRPELDYPYVPPRDALEADVAAIWGRVLGLDRVGRDDHFLDLGGNSLLALDVVARLRTRFGLDLHMNVIFESPTVAALSEALAAARHAPSAPGLAANQLAGSEA